MARKAATQSRTSGKLTGRDTHRGALRDTRQGAYDPVANQKVPNTSQASPHEKGQTGGSMQGEPVPAPNIDLPEGLQRERKGPYGRKTGRGKKAEHAPARRSSAFTER